MEQQEAGSARMEEEQEPQHNGITPHPQEEATHNHNDESDVAQANSMAFAAAEAAAAAAAAEVQEFLADKKCRICCKDSSDGRTMIHFAPILQEDPTVAQYCPNVTTFTEDVTMHVFCGKTASILPHVNMPRYEILSKAGIKNKHGIGTEVNTALARTRCAIVSSSTNTKKKKVKETHFYMVQEFEAHLNAIRISSGTQYQYQTQQVPEIAIPPHPHHLYVQPPPDNNTEEQQYYTTTTTSPIETQHHSSLKPSPVRANAGISAFSQKQPPKDWAYYAIAPSPQDQQELTAEGKVQCKCGGTHLPTSTSKGAASWRNHITTKRHIQWMEDHGLLGAV